MTPLALSSLQVKNFKAIRNSGRLKLTPLTALIGYNGSGKSSLVEALETLQTISLQGLDEAMVPWHGFEYIHNPAAKGKRQSLDAVPMSFALQGRAPATFKAKIEINDDGNYDTIAVQSYQSSTSSAKLQNRSNFIIDDGIIDPNLKSFVKPWQFLRLDPNSMTEPRLQRRSVKTIHLNSDGSNIAEYLLSIRNLDSSAFDGIVDTLKTVIPYAQDLQPAITSQLDRKVYLTLSEEGLGDRKLPSWLLSSGTLRILALLAVLRHPNPPSLLVIEEIENGLDPRTIQLLVGEMREFIQSGRGQIIITTHSPYFLDLLTLSQIVVVERDKNGSPQFMRPDSQETLEKWGRKFAPGKLYTMGALSRGNAS